MNEEKRITVKDIATLAGVSKGTVDRVLHNRGEVSEASREKVMRIARQIGYKPNMHASLLASQKRYVMVCMIPEYAPGEYWDLVAKGITAAQKKAEPFRISIQLFKYDLFSERSMDECFARVMEQRPDAVVMAPTFQSRARAIMDELHARDIPCLLIDSCLPDCTYLAYFGMHMMRSGYLAAHLLTDRCSADKIAVFRIHKDMESVNNSAESRYAGFRQYLEEHAPHTELIHLYIHPYDREYNRTVLRSFFVAHPDVRHIITFNSRVHLIAEYLKQEGRESSTVLIGFDHLPRNVGALENGTVKFLITQHTENILSLCAQTVINHLIYHVPPVQRDTFLPMDILTRYNADFYRPVLI